MSAVFDVDEVTLKANISKSELGIFLLHTILKHLVYLKEQIPTYVCSARYVFEKTKTRKHFTDPWMSWRSDTREKRIRRSWYLERERDRWCFIKI